MLMLKREGHGWTWTDERKRVRLLPHVAPALRGTTLALDIYGPVVHTRTPLSHTSAPRNSPDSTVHTYIIAVIVVVVWRTEVGETYLLVRLHFLLGEDGEQGLVQVGFIDVCGNDDTVGITAVVLRMMSVHCPFMSGGWNL